MEKPSNLVLASSIIFGSLLSSALTLGGVYFLLEHNKNVPDNTTASSADQINQIKADKASFLSAFFSSETPVQKPVFHTLEKVVLSVKDDEHTHFVVLGIAIETRSPDIIGEIDAYMPVVKNSLYSLFSTKHYEDLKKEGAFKFIQEEVKNQLITAFKDTEFTTHIDDVLLTKFVVQ